jgi:hypothetical protein
MAKQLVSVVPTGPGHRAVYFTSTNGTLRYYVPGHPSPIVHYRFAPDGSQAFRRVLNPDGTLILFTEVVYLGEHPRCTCGVTDHTALAADKLKALHQYAERRLPPEALWDLERELHSRPDLRTDDGEYDGGFGEWPDEYGDPQRIAWNEDPSEGLLHLKEDPRAFEGVHARVRAQFLAGLAAGATDGVVDVLAPVVERVLFRTVTHPPGIAGGWEDLFQEGMATAIQQTVQLSPYHGEDLDQFAARLDRRVATAVRHRLIDLIRRQDAAARNTPLASLEAGQDAGLNVPAPDGDAFDLLFRPHERARRDARARAIALAVYRDSRGLARRIIRRAYVTAFRGKRTAGTLEFGNHPDYPVASKALVTSWTRYLAQAMRGALRPVYDRPRGTAPRPGRAAAGAV